MAGGAFAGWRSLLRSAALPSAAAVAWCGACAAGAASVYAAVAGVPTEVLVHPSAASSARRLLNEAGESLRRYHPTFWLPSPHASTVAMIFLRGSPFAVKPTYRRELVTLRDGGQLSLDWYAGGTDSLPRESESREGGGLVSVSGSTFDTTPPTASPQDASPARPVLLLLCGLTGNSHKPYVHNAIRHVAERLGFRCVIMNARGCGETPVRADTPPRLLNVASSADLADVVAHLRSRMAPEAPLYAIGFSLGAGVLAQFLGDAGERSGIDAAVACGGAFDMAHAMGLLRAGWLSSRAYDFVFARALATHIALHEAALRAAQTETGTLSSLVNIAVGKAATRTATVLERVLAPMHGFASGAEFAAAASSVRALERVRVPFLLLGARDDPVADPRVVPAGVVQGNPCLLSVQTAAGGHTAWAQGLLPFWRTWDNDATAAFLGAVERLRLPGARRVAGVAAAPSQAAGVAGGGGGGGEPLRASAVA